MLQAKTQNKNDKAIDAVAGILQALVKGIGKKRSGGQSGNAPQNTNIAGCGGCSAKR
jgi:hypothetical protein